MAYVGSKTNNFTTPLKLLCPYNYKYNEQGHDYKLIENNVCQLKMKQAVIICVTISAIRSQFEAVTGNYVGNPTFNVRTIHMCL